MHGSARAWLVRKVRLATVNRLPDSGNQLLISGCGRSVRDRHRNSAANGGQLPGATGGAHAAGLVIAIAVVMALAVPRIRLSCRCPLQAAGPDPWPGGCGCGTADMMNVFTANDLQAADLLALARPGDAAAPPAVAPPPASHGAGRHAIRLAGAGQVTASPGGDDRSSARPRPPAARHEAYLSCPCGSGRARDSSSGRHAARSELAAGGDR